MINDKNEIGVSNSVNIVGSDEYVIVSSHELDSSPNKISECNLQNSTFYDKPLSSVKQYEDEWNELFGHPEIDIEKLRLECTSGQLRTSHFRSICWRCLLGILHKEPKEWICQLQTYRKHYDEVCRELEQNPWNVKEYRPYDNPLSQESDSIWQKYFCDEELKSIVNQDVKRTFPGMDFFQKEHIQQMMVRILFCYARQNPALCYRQGMHEILAPLIFIIHCDHQAFLHAQEQDLKANETMLEILNPGNLEQDAFSIFKFIMNHIECSYRINNLVTTLTGYFPVETEKYENKTCQNEVISRLDNIKKTILQQKDPELNDHLEKLDIPLHLFGIRWLRLLFGREFMLQDLLVLWDFIFANNFETVNYIVVAMLIAIRQTLLVGDYTDCLSNLMRYPSGVDVTYIIDYALHLKDPEKYLAPDSSRALSLAVKNKPSSQSTPTSAENQAKFNRRLKRGSSRPPQWFPGKSNLLLLGQNGDGDSNIAHGYIVDDPNILKAELEQAKMILTVVQQKLVQYHTSLSVNLQCNSNPNVQLALDGLYELSTLVKNHCKETTCEIETACEAGEIKEPKIQSPQTSITSNVDNNKSPGMSVNSDKRSHTLPKTKRGPKSGELMVFKHHVGGQMSGAPMIDPLHLIKDLSLDESVKSNCS